MPVIVGKLKRTDELRVDRIDLFNLFLAPLGPSPNETFSLSYDKSREQLVIQRESTFSLSYDESREQLVIRRESAETD